MDWRRWSSFPGRGRSACAFRSLPCPDWARDELLTPQGAHRTICGTPNYIAPEILFESKGTGHSFEVDIWSIGVILCVAACQLVASLLTAGGRADAYRFGNAHSYTLLIGKPPFQTKDVKNIYRSVAPSHMLFLTPLTRPLRRKIRDNAYTFPSDHLLSAESTSLISSILQPDPLSRPSLPSILSSSWFITGPFPSRISSRALDPERANEMCEEWRYMTKRQSWDNFRRCKRKSGIVEVEEGGEVERAARKGEAAQVVEAVSQALPTVAEAVEEEDEQEPMQQEEVVQPPKKAIRMVRPSEEREAKGRVEKEVRAATAPDSPISELLRCALPPSPLRFGLAHRTTADVAACAGLLASPSWFRLPPAPSRRPRLLLPSAEQPRRASTRCSSGLRPPPSQTLLPPPRALLRARHGEPIPPPHSPHGIVEQAHSHPSTFLPHILPPPPHLPQNPQRPPPTPLARSTTRPGAPSTPSSPAPLSLTSRPSAHRSSMRSRMKTSCERQRCLSARGSTIPIAAGRRTA